MLTFADIIWAPVWIGVTLLLGATGWIIGSRLFPTDAPSMKIGHAIIICWAHLSVASTILSLSGWLAPVPLLASVGGLAILSLNFVPQQPPVRESVAAFLNSTASPWESWLWAGVWSALFGFWVGHSITGGVLRFPDDWDTLMYHLPLVDHWLQARSSYAPASLRWSDPGNNELIALWLVAPFSGDFLYGLNNLPATILLACGASAIGRQLGLSLAWRNLGTLAVVSNHIVLRQLTDAENDVAVAALFLGSLGYGLRYIHDRRPADLALGAISLGLLAGVKFYALGYAGVVAITLAAVIARRWGWRSAVRAASVGACGLMIFGGYWYVRNWIEGGSPLYPFGAPAEGQDLTAQYPDMWRTTFIGNGSPELFSLAVRALWGMTGPCHLAAGLSMPITVLFLLLRQQGGRPEPRLALAVSTVAAFLVLLVTPFAVEDMPGTLNQMHWKYCPVRYSLAFLSAALLCLVAFLDTVTARLLESSEVTSEFQDNSPPASRPESFTSRLRGTVSGGCGVVLYLLFTAGIVYQFGAAVVGQFPVAVLDATVIGGNLVLARANLGLLYAASSRGKRAAFGIVVMGSLFGGTVGIDWLSDRWHRGFVPFYDKVLGGGLLAHIRHEFPPGTTVCVLDMRPYPFFGSAREYRVCQPGRIESASWWERYLDEQDVRLVVARLDINAQGRWVHGGRWLADRPDLYDHLESHTWPYTVYRTRRRPPD